MSDRVYKCSCGLEIDRDLNAAINLAKNYILSARQESTPVEIEALVTCSNTSNETLVAEAGTKLILTLTKKS